MLPRRDWAALWSSDNERGASGLLSLLAEPQGHMALVVWGLLCPEQQWGMLLGPLGQQGHALGASVSSSHANWGFASLLRRGDRRRKGSTRKRDKGAWSHGPESHKSRNLGEGLESSLSQPQLSPLEMEISLRSFLPPSFPSSHYIQDDEAVVCL